MKSRTPDYLGFRGPGVGRKPQALGVEGYYLPSSKMSSFLRLRHRPAAHQRSGLLGDERNPRLVARDGDVERWILPPGTFSYPLGAKWFRLSPRGSPIRPGERKIQDTHVRDVS